MGLEERELRRFVGVLDDFAHRPIQTGRSVVIAGHAVHPHAVGDSTARIRRRRRTRRGRPFGFISLGRDPGIVTSPGAARASAARCRSGGRTTPCRAAARTRRNASTRRSGRDARTRRQWRPTDIIFGVFRAFLVHRVESVPEIGEELIPRVEALGGREAHVVGVEGVGNDKVGPACGLGPEGQVVVVIVGVVEEILLLRRPAGGCWGSCGPYTSPAGVPRRSARGFRSPWPCARVRPLRQRTDSRSTASRGCTVRGRPEAPLPRPSGFRSSAMATAKNVTGIS